ncbi:PotD/PotF family extracellular solute-binding protein [Lichenifustis flavocetrariae]|uniref:PotD/PotF family extracellular solute-binding protein n=1 Tax=Lichenifustis flavocetrariae TaxID=2949735 RepID=A0AA41YZM6_9HYPH|nr:PotD/PotF family extracellular solute-binding protein [Lichenifustis flavocetrariae]MCW6511064.1 PotD/PotF family extracellular solute-binding protein [Lichenifustis flavocetrariae]
MIRHVAALAFLVLTSVTVGERVDAAEKAGTVRVLSISDALDPASLDTFGRETGIGVLVDSFVASDAIERMMRAAAPPYDLVLIPASALGPLLKAGLLARLDAAAVPDAVPIEPRLVEALAALSGTGFAVPFDWYATVLALNAARLKAANVTLDAGTGWDVLTKPDVLRAVAACGFGVPDQPRTLYALTLAITVPPDRAPTVLDRRRALSVLAQLKLAAKSGTEAELADSAAQGDLCAAILPGPAAVLASERAKVAESGVDLMVLTPQTGSLLWMDVLAVPAASVNRDAGLALLRFLLRPETAAIMARAGHVAPATRNPPAPGIGNTADAAMLRSLVIPQPLDPALARVIETQWQHGAAH